MRAEGVVDTTPGARNFESFVWSHFKRFGKELRHADLPATLEQQVRDAVAGRGVEKPQVDLSALPDFERRVLETLISIPNGELRSYGWVAREAGRPGAVRAVGNVCAHNPVPLVVPCHRVVPATGGLGGYGYGPEMKRKMLEREGVDLERVERLDQAKAKYVKAGEEWYCFPTCRHVRGIAWSELEPVRDEREAAALGLIPCDDCRPLVSAA
jgi:O-6-methylguanine DNA methyltransferase